MIEGELVDLRRFQNDETGTRYSDVSTFIFDDAQEYGWVTASSPNTGLLLGYLWRVKNIRGLLSGGRDRTDEWQRGD